MLMTASYELTSGVGGTEGFVDLVAGGLDILEKIRPNFEFRGFYESFVKGSLPGLI